MKAIELKNVYFSYNNEFILEDVSIEVDEKGFVVVVGPNGGGKTTLLKIIMGFLYPVKGRVRVFNKPPAMERHHIGYVPQFAEYKKDFPLTAKDVVLTGLLKATSIFPWYSKNEKKKAEQALEKVGISNLVNKKIDNLSGGQKQRVLIARALVSEPDILLLDEPTASIDPQVEQDIYDLLNKLNEKIAIVLVTHDVAFVSRYAKTVACLNRKISVNSVDKVVSENFDNLYNTPMNFLDHHCKL